MKKVFIIEDDKALRAELERILQLQGFEPVICLDFSNAINQALCEEPDIIILDLGLPENDGLSICREIRSFRGPFHFMLEETPSMMLKYHRHYIPILRRY